MALELVTTHTGNPHVTAAQAAVWQAGVVGKGKHVLDVLDNFKATQVSANQVTVGKGAAVIDGRLIVAEQTETVTIENGSQTGQRNDLICIRYQKQGSQESTSLVVVKGETTGGGYDYHGGRTRPSYGASDPDTYKNNSIFKGDEIVDLPLWRVRLDGIQADKPERIAPVITTLKDAADTIEAHTSDIAIVKSGMDGFGDDLASLRSRVLSIEDGTGSIFEKLGEWNKANGEYLRLACRNGVAILEVRGVTLPLDRGLWGDVYTGAGWIPEKYCPKQWIQVPLCVDTGDPWVACVQVGTDGNIKIQKRGVEAKAKHPTWGQAVWFY